MSKTLLGFKVLLSFLSSHIKSDDIPPEMKLDDVNNTEMGKVNKSVKMWTQILFRLSGRMFFLCGKNEEEPKCPSCKVNTLKADISPLFDLQTLLSLVNPLSASFPLIQKPANWFALQIDWLVSIWGQHWHLLS